MRFTIFAAMFLCLSATASEPLGGSKQQDLSGVYEIAGSEGKSYYAGVAILVKAEDGNDYSIQWTNRVGANVKGIGHVENGKLIAAWTTHLGSGLTIYEINGKKLSGRWMAAPALEWHTETLTYKFAWPKAKEDDGEAMLRKK